MTMPDIHGCRGMWFTKLASYAFALQLHPADRFYISGRAVAEAMAAI
jgi:hypothetical protein